MWRCWQRRSRMLQPSLAPGSATTRRSHYHGVIASDAINRQVRLSRYSETLAADKFRGTYLRQLNLIGLLQSYQWRRMGDFMMGAAQQ
eukprot:900927-Pyramimonas_sp.AAC.1